MHNRKMVAPIVVTAILVLYCIGYVLAVVLIPGIPLWIKIVFGVIPLALAVACIFMMRERIQEIRSGEEDDLSQY